MKLNKFVILIPLLVGGLSGCVPTDEASLPSVVEQTEVVIYSVNGTLPTLYAGLNMVQDTRPSYVYFERSGTLDIDNLPEHVLGAVTDSSYDNITYIKDKIKELHTVNPNTKFHLFCDDLRIQFELEYFIAQGISNYEVTLLSDGTGTYTYALGTNTVSENANFSGEDGEANFKAWQNFYDDLVEKAENGEDIESTLNPDKIGNPMRIAPAAIYAAKSEKIDYWMQYPELIIDSSTSAYVNQQYDDADLSAVHPFELYSELSEEEKAKFLEMVYFVKDDFDALLDESDKPNMVITGTSYTGSGDFEGYINEVLAKFGDEYDYFYKAHPAYPPVSGHEIMDADFLTESGIGRLPDRMPMEVLMWAYPDLKIGGYNSSLYMSADTDNVLFFLGVTDGTKLVSPLDKLAAQGKFDKATYIVVE